MRLVMQPLVNLAAILVLWGYAGWRYAWPWPIDSR